MVTFITAMFVSTGEIFGGSGIAILLLGAAHSTDSRVPAFGYWTVFFLVWAIRWVPLVITMNQRGGRTREWGEKE